MKTILYALVVVAVMGLALELFYNKDVEVINKVEKEEIIKEVHPDWATDNDAVEAAKAVIQKKEWEAELNVVQREIEALTARETELEKNLGTY
jgi:hypothetical protein